MPSLLTPNDSFMGHPLMGGGRKALPSGPPLKGLGLGSCRKHLVLWWGLRLGLLLYCRCKLKEPFRYFGRRGFRGVCGKQRAQN